jgi:S1-C subfamily serine protease
MTAHMKRLIVLVAALVSIGFAAGLVIAGRLSITSPTAADPAPQAVAARSPATAAPPAAPGAALPDLSAIAETALKAAANISSTQVDRQRLPWPFWMDGDQFQERQSQSVGSGVVVRSDGLILTNAHVIGNTATDIRVTLNDGQERPAELVGIDELSDLAVIKVKASNLQTLPWGDSSKLRVAEWVLAIGNPFQLSGTVTLGIVSTVNRSQSGSYTDFIQTDAAVNPGNSGGALVNARGELVGINSAIYSLQDAEHAAYQGISFAIPSKAAREIMDALVAHGSVPWGSIGYVEWMDADTVARYYGVRGRGLLVARISQRGAAYRAGLRLGDWILSFDGQPATDSDQFKKLIARAKIGTRVPMEIDRNGSRRTITVQIESREQQQPATAAPGAR